MDFLTSQSSQLPGESTVRTIGEVASRGLDNYADEAKRTFDLLWSDPDSRQDKLDRMGNQAALAFAQHFDTVTHLLRSYARAAFIASGASVSDLNAALADPTMWTLTHTGTPLADAIMDKMPGESWIPPAAYTINANGTVTIV